MQYWIMKSEPQAYSIDDLKRDGVEPWDGIRNYQSRNFMRDGMKVRDQCLFYHSSCPEPGVAGIMTVASRAYPDPTQFDKKSNYYDPKSAKDDPRWQLVDVKFKKKLSRIIPLAEIKQHPGLSDLILNRRGNRLSIMPVSAEHWKLILAME